MLQSIESLGRQNLGVFIAGLQGDATGQEEDLVALDEVIGDNSALFVRFILQAGLKVLHPLSHSQCWVQRGRGQTGTNFLEDKQSLNVEIRLIHLKQ